MAEIIQTDTSVIQNLKDAGCSPEMTEQFMQLRSENQYENQLRLLFGHRAGLLEKLHEYQRKIDCLDYLMNGMKKEKDKTRKKTRGGSV